jgi:hypothetical protein
MTYDFPVADLQNRWISRPYWAQHREPLLTFQSVVTSISLPATSQPEEEGCLPSSALRISFFDIAFSSTFALRRRFNADREQSVASLLASSRCLDLQAGGLGLRVFVLMVRSRIKVFLAT